MPASSLATLQRTRLCTRPSRRSSQRSPATGTRRGPSQVTSARSVEATAESTALLPSSTSSFSRSSRLFMNSTGASVPGQREAQLCPRWWHRHGVGARSIPAWLRDASRLTFHTQREMHLVVAGVADEDAAVAQLRLPDGETARGALAAHQQPPARAQRLSVLLPLCRCHLWGQPGHQCHAVPLQHLQRALRLLLVDNAYGPSWGVWGTRHGSGLSPRCPRDRVAASREAAMPAVGHHGGLMGVTVHPAVGWFQWLGVAVGQAGGPGGTWQGSRWGRHAGWQRLAAPGLLGEGAPDRDGGRAHRSCIPPCTGSCWVGAINFSGPLIPRALLGGWDNCLHQTLSHPCPVLHPQLIRVQAEFSPWQPKQEERRLGASQG